MVMHILIWTRREDIEDMRVDGVSKSRRMYLVGGPGTQQGGGPAPRDNPNPSGVIEMKEGFQNFNNPIVSEGTEEVLPTPVRLILDWDGRPRNGKGGGGKGGASGSGQRV
ncbi:hypothetical protein K435DRAFT_199095 [Dendrothele bispora CBS 962.96]|uniref:Uncharacterized protein n=1 Tax=Dendrothele bispora (strain CBS 962.96) TaxID=1314807 RepID=A0A4S8LUN6_DENBC|nr:hypothetical protein K435DRAFT_199095 [Dendrothele bispora CBS 962.96]